MPTGLVALLIFVVLCVVGVILAIGLAMMMCPHVPEEAVVKAATEYTKERKIEDVRWNESHPGR